MYDSYKNQITNQINVFFNNLSLKSKFGKDYLGLDYSNI